MTLRPRSFLVLAAALFLARPVPAAEPPPLPSWTAEVENWSSWAQINFRDGANWRRLWVHWPDLRGAKAGALRLYHLTEQSRGPRLGYSADARVIAYSSELTPFWLLVGSADYFVVRPGRETFLSTGLGQAQMYPPDLGIKVAPPLRLVEEDGLPSIYSDRNAVPGDFDKASPPPEAEKPRVDPERAKDTLRKAEKAGGH